MNTRSALLLSIVSVACMGGCSSTAPPVPEAASPSGLSSSAANEAQAGNPAVSPPLVIPQISLGPVDAETSVNPADAGSRRSPANSPRSTSQPTAIIEALKPLQIMLGEWRGTTQREFGDFKALDQPHWVWDLLSEPEQPALVMSSADSRYFRQARLTYHPDRNSFAMRTIDPAGMERRFEGRFTREVEEFQGEDRQLHRKYLLELSQVDAVEAREAWQIGFNQLDNNRYLLELSRRRGNGFLRFDTVATQRAGTSIAQIVESYGDRECIISGGLGTISVSHQGKTYWVCCTGCQAAFKEDPDKWLAARAESK